jgi:membrane fusion protein (multidrug efflux system)
MIPREVVFAIVMLLVVFALAGCSPNASEPEIEFRVPVTVREVETGTVEDRVVATGTLRPVEEIVLNAGANGILRYARDDSGRRVRDGDLVKAGQVIAEIVGADVRLEARTESNERRYKVALRNYESSKSLFDDGLITEQELRRVEAEFTDARVTLDSSLLKEDRARIKSPIDGVVRLGRNFSDAPVADGQLVNAGFVVAEIAPIDRLIADVDLVGSDISRVRVGQIVRVLHYAWSDRVFPGTVILLESFMNPETRTFNVQVQIDNPERLLLSGMFVEVILVADERADVPVVPRTAVVERGGSKVVFVVEGQKVTRREIVLGLGDDEIVEVRQGLDAGERIVVKGLETLSDGTRVLVSGV